MTRLNSQVVTQQLPFDTCVPPGRRRFSRSKIKARHTDDSAREESVKIDRLQMRFRLTVTVPLRSPANNNTRFVQDSIARIHLNPGYLVGQARYASQRPSARTRLLRPAARQLNNEGGESDPDPCHVVLSFNAAAPQSSHLPFQSMSLSPSQLQFEVTHHVHFSTCSNSSSRQQQLIRRDGHACTPQLADRFRRDHPSVISVLVRFSPARSCLDAESRAEIGVGSQTMATYTYYYCWTKDNLSIHRRWKNATSSLLPNVYVLYVVASPMWSAQI